MEKTIKATAFHRPDGRSEQIIITQVNSENADYINENNIKVSIERDSIDGFIIYFDYGQVDKEGEPIEHIELSLGKTCMETIQQAIIKLKLTN